MTDVLDRAKTVQRNVADGTTLSVKLSLLEDLIAEIERLRAERPFKPVSEQQTVASMEAIRMKHTGINHP